MSEITYISEELVMEGNLDSAGSSVVVAGRFKGELRAKDVLLEANSIFDGNLIADKVTLGTGGVVSGTGDVYSRTDGGWNEVLSKVAQVPGSKVKPQKRFP